MPGSGPVGGGSDWLRGGMATVLADLNNQGVSAGQQLYQPAASQLFNTAPYLQGSANTYLGNYMQNMQNPIEGAAGNTNQLFQSILGNTTGNGNGGYQNALTNAGTVGMGAAGSNLDNYSNNFDNLLGSTLQGQGNIANQAAQGFQGGGMTPQMGGGYDAIAQLLGQQTPGLQTSAGTANNLIGGQGQNPFNQQLEQYALQSAASGGQNNPQSQALLHSALPLLQSFGQTNLSQGLANQGMNLFNQQALMNPSQAASLARNQQGTANAQAEKQQEQMALNRGGGPGATVANGLQNQTEADFADQNARSLSNAVTQALQGQQGLQLQQQLGGGQAAQGAGGLQNNMLGTAAGMGQGSGSLANSFLNSYINGGGTGSQNQLGMLGQGGNLASMLQSGQIGGLGALNNLLGTQTGYQLGLGGLNNNINTGLSNSALQGNNALGNLYNQMYGTGIQSGQLGNSLFGGLTNALNQNYQTATGFGSGLTNIYNAGTNPLQAILQGGLGLSGTGLSGQASLFGNSGQTAGGQNPLATAGIAAAAALAKGGG